MSHIPVKKTRCEIKFSDPTQPNSKIFLRMFPNQYQFHFGQVRGNSGFQKTALKSMPTSYTLLYKSVKLLSELS